MSKKKKILILLLVVIAFILLALMYLYTSNGDYSQFYASSEEIKAKGVTGTPDPSTWDTNKVKIVYDTAGVAVPVPTGYTASSVTGEQTVSTGFVIYEGYTTVTDSNVSTYAETNNQFVWVPVSDPTELYEQDSTTGEIKSKLYTALSTSSSSPFSTYENNGYEPCVLDGVDIASASPAATGGADTLTKGFSGYGGTKTQNYTQEQLLEELEAGLEDIIVSIETYGGFYIGRYETGDITSETPVVTKMNTTLQTDWYTAYENSKNISTKTNTQTGMIYGCLWDATLSYLRDNGLHMAYISTAGSYWGNYYSNSITYTTTSGTTATTTANVWTQIPTGSSDTTCKCNIYDLAGNVAEWTTEGYGNYYRVARGNTACYVSGWATNISASYRFYFGPQAQNSQINVGSRAYMIIK